MSSPLFSEMVTAVRSDLKDAMLATKPGEFDQRENLYHEFNALERLMGKLNAYVGELAMLEPDEKEKLSG